jgi:hypothetical protein
VATGSGPFAILTGDFNNDGKLDLATADYTVDTITILLGNGDGTFTAATVAPTAGGGPDGMVAGDFNGDGLLDIVTANYEMTAESIILQATSSTTVSVSGLTTTGTDNVYAVYSGDTNFLLSQSVTLPLLSIIVQTQTISFPNPGAQAYGTPLELSATATSGLPVSFTVISGPATLSGSNLLTFTGIGSVTVQAAQGGNGFFAAATPVNQTFTVSAGAQTITFPNPGTLPDGVAPVTLTATASSGLPVTYTLISGPGTISGDTLTVTDVGNIVVEADQAGNPDYSAAPAVQITIQVVSSNFTLAPQSSSAATVTPGQSATIPVTVYSVSGFTGSLSFTCTTPSAMLGASCSASTVQITGNAPASAKVIVSTTAANQSASLSRPKPSSPKTWPFIPSGIAFVAVVVVSAGDRKKFTKSVPLIAFMMVAMLMLGCGGGSSGTTNSSNPATPAGTYNLTLVGNSGSSSATLMLPVTVK